MSGDGQERSRVSAAIWRWDAADTSGPTERARVRRRSAIQAAVMLAVGLALLFLGRHGKLRHGEVMGPIVLGLAALVFVSGQWIPAVFAGLERLGGWLAYVVGTTLTWLLLVPVFVICFVPARIIDAVRGRDTLCREFPGGQASYWQDYALPSDAKQYEKQF